MLSLSFVRSVSEKRKTKRKDQTYAQRCSFGLFCRRRCVARGGVAPRGRLWPGDSAALLPEHAGTDGGQREDSCSVRCPAGCRRLHRHPAPPYWEDLRRCAGTQRDMRPSDKAARVPGLKITTVLFLVILFECHLKFLQIKKKFLTLYDKYHILSQLFHGTC